MSSDAQPILKQEQEQDQHEHEPDTTTTPALITIVVQDQSGHQVIFKVKPKTKLGKVFNAYCVKLGLNRMTTKFLFDGQRVMDDNTCEQMDIEDNDVIDCVLEQIGGGLF